MVRYGCLIMILVLALLYSCDSGELKEEELYNKPDKPENVDSVRPCFLNFAFLVKNNKSLKENIFLHLKEDSITDIFVPNLQTDSLIPTFDGVYDYVQVVQVGGGKSRVW